jgi:uncharacterized membrane protein
MKPKTPSLLQIVSLVTALCGGVMALDSTIKELGFISPKLSMCWPLVLVASTVISRLAAVIGDFLDDGQINGSYNPDQPLPPRKPSGAVSVEVLVVVIVLLLLLGAGPWWGYSAHWGYAPFGGLFGLLILLIILRVCGVFAVALLLSVASLSGCVAGRQAISAYNRTVSAREDSLNGFAKDGNYGGGWTHRVEYVQ